MSSIARPSVTIERAQGDELDDVLSVMNAAFDPRFGEAWTRAQCAGILPMGGVTLVVARNAGDVVGFSLVRSTLDEAELLLIAVSPDHARQGIGSRLIDHVVAEQQKEGVENLHLEVRDGNPAVQLYAKHGFSIVGRRSNYYRGLDGEKFDALTMARQI